MRHLSEYLKESIRDLQLQNYRYEFLSNHFNGNVPDYVEEKFYNGNYVSDCVFEFLKSQDFSFVLKELYSIYGNKLIGYFEETNSSKTPLFCIVVSKENKSIYKEKEFKDVLSKFKYSFSAIEKNLKNNTFNILIEPIYPEIANDKIKLHYGKYAYHVASKDNYETIKRTGLRPKTNFANREYDPRIYFVATDNDVKTKIKSIIDSVYDGDESKCVILKIELPIKAINIYKDESRKDNYSYYTYTAIPASLIKLVKLDKI